MSLAVVRDTLNSKPFQLADISVAVNDIIPYTPQQVGRLGIFQSESLFTDVAEIWERQGQIGLIPTSSRGGPSEQNIPDKATIRTVKTFRLSIEDQINAAELFKVIAFHSAAGQQSLEIVRNQRLTTMARKLDHTLEHMRLNALKGDVLDANTSSLTNLFTLFGKTQEPEVPFDLTNVTKGHLAGVISDMQRRMYNNLEADSSMVDHIHVLCSPSFYDALLQNIDIFTWATVPPNSDYLRRSRVFGTFEWYGIVFEEYRLGTLATAAGGSWIDTDKCIIFPVGPDIYTNFWSPGEYFGVLGTAGAPRYARAAADTTWDEWIKLKLQSYPLPIVTRPLALMKGRKGA